MAPIMPVDIKRVGITHLVRGVYQHGLTSMRSHVCINHARLFIWEMNVMLIMDDISAYRNLLFAHTRSPDGAIVNYGFTFTSVVML